MADKRTTPDMPEGVSQPSPEQPRPKKRAAPTIDLTATEVPPAEGTAPSQPEPPPAAEESPTTEADAEQADAVVVQGSSSFGIAALAGGAAGVAATVLILLGLWFSGLLPSKQEPTTKSMTQVATDTKALDALTERVNALDARIKNLPISDADLTGRLAAAENAMKSLGVALAALGHRSDDIAANASQARERADAAMKAVADLKKSLTSNEVHASPAGLEALDKRVAALENVARSTQADISKIAATSSGNDLAARLALSAEVLRDAVAVGTPFTDELATVKALGGDDKALAPLAPFAITGVPTAQTLAKELHALLPAMEKSAGAVAPRGGFLERLQANASRLVRIQPVNAPQGDEPSTVLARLEVDTSRADIAAALNDLGKLDSATRAPAQSWIKRAQAQQAALDAARNYAAETARALAPKAGAQ